MSLGVKEHGTKRQRTGDLGARIWEGWAADIQKEHPGSKVDWQWWRGFTATRPDGQNLTSCNPSMIEGFLAASRRSP
jgi:hypothetical protein